MRVKIFGTTYRLSFCRLHGEADGLCHPPTSRKPTIFIESTLTPRKELETTIHELLHACLWWLSEEWVTQAARVIADVLWRRGWRRVPHGRR